MTTLREFALQDLFAFNRIFFDQLTEVYPLKYFVDKILEYPLLTEVAIAPDGQIMGILIGCRSIEADDRVGDGKDNHLNNNHGHVCTLSINHVYRCLGLGTHLMNRFNAKLELKQDLYVDLFVRSRNVKAIRLYKSLGYVIYRKLPYFYDDDHGYDMRLPLSRDVDHRCLHDRECLAWIIFPLLRLPIKYLLKLWNALLHLLTQQFL